MFEDLGGKKHKCHDQRDRSKTAVRKEKKNQEYKR